MKMTFKQLAKYGSSALVLCASGASMAAIDVASSVTLISGSDIAVYAVGTAVFGVLVAIATTKWVRRAL